MSDSTAMSKAATGEDRSLVAYLMAAFEHRRMIWIAGAKFIRDAHSRTVLGIWWLIVRALMPTIAIIVILQHVAVLQEPGLPYALYVTSGMLLWTPLQIGMRKGVRALTQTARLTRHFAFPHINAVLAANAISVVYLAIFTVFFCILLLWYAILGDNHVVISLRLLLVPVILALFFIFISGVLSVLSVLFVVSKDVRFIMPILIHVWFFATPIVYHLTLLPEKWRAVVLLLNPIANLVVSFRWSLFNMGEWSPLYFGVTVAEVLVTFLVGAWFMMRAEKALRIVL
jgi:lipopolysaccharide transport system permease protein